MSLYPPESVSPKEALSEECPECEGGGEVYAGLGILGAPGTVSTAPCQACNGTGRRIRERVPPAVLSAVGHMLLDRNDQVLAKKDEQIRALQELVRRQRDIVAAFLRELDFKGVDLQDLVLWEPASLTPYRRIHLDDELLIQLRDLVRRP